MTWIHLWILLSAFGGVLSFYLARESYLDMKAFGLKYRFAWPPIYFSDESNGSVRHAVSRFIREFLRFTVHVGYLAIGLPAWNLDPPMSPGLAGLMWGNIVLVTNSFIDARTIRPTMPRWIKTHRPETVIERQDRTAGNFRRELQAKDEAELAREKNDT